MDRMTRVETASFPLPDEKARGNRLQLVIDCCNLGFVYMAFDIGELFELFFGPAIVVRL